MATMCSNCKHYEAVCHIYTPAGNQWFMCQYCKDAFEIGQMRPIEPTHLLTTYPLPEESNG